MSEINYSTNMNLPVPTVGEASGPDWASNLDSCMTILDAHDHSPGNGVQITPSGININADLPFNSSYGITTIKKVSFTSQVSALTGTGFASNVAGNLYWNDGSGNQVQITSGGGVAGSPGSIGSLTAPAAATYSAGSKLFTWTADSGKSAAMDNGAVTIRETNVASAKGITLASPSALASDYQLTLPAAVPASTQYMTSTSSGVLSFSTADTIGAAMTSTGANAVANTRTRAAGSTVAAGGVAVSTSNSGSFVTSSTSLVDVTNLTVTITTTGRPVYLTLQGNTPTEGYLGVLTISGTNTSVSGTIAIQRGVTVIASSNMRLFFSSTSDTCGYRSPPGSIIAIDTSVNGSAGTYTYKVTAAAGNAAYRTEVGACYLVAYEL